MKKLLLITTLTLFLQGCRTYVEDELSDMKKPAVVVAIKHRDSYIDGSIVIRSADGVYTTITGDTYTGAALLNSLSAGDTIR